MVKYVGMGRPEFMLDVRREVVYMTVHKKPRQKYMANYVGVGQPEMCLCNSKKSKDSPRWLCVAQNLLTKVFIYDKILLSDMKIYVKGKVRQFFSFFCIKKKQPKGE